MLFIISRYMSHPEAHYPRETNGDSGNSISGQPFVGKIEENMEANLPDTPR